MIEKLETFKKDKKEIIGQNACSKYLNTRIEKLSIEDIKNEEKIEDLLDMRSEDDYVEEYEEAIEKFFSGDANANIDNKVEKILEVFSKGNFDISSYANQAKTEDEKAMVFWDIIREIKRDDERVKSLKIAIEQQKINGIELEGFEKDKDFSGIHKFLEKAFPDGLLNKALISKITYLPDIVDVSILGKIYFLPLDKYFKWKKKFRDLSLYKTRAVNRGSSNRIGLFHSAPIEIYSFTDENLRNFEYLEDVDENRKMCVYKLGTIAHEVGHNFYTNLLNNRKKNKWKEIINSIGNLTYYSRKYSEGIHGNSVNYEEEFAEAIRLMTTCQKYLKKKFPEAYNFLSENFPELK